MTVHPIALPGGRSTNPTRTPSPPPPLQSSVVAPTKPFGTFSEFYPHYLTEHRQAGTKRFHLAGTAVLLALLGRTPDLLLALLGAGTVGLAAFPLMRGLSSGVPEFCLMLGVYAVLGRRLVGSWRTPLALPLPAYTFAWLGHALVEHNKPATFTYPVFSLLGDLRMAADMVTGRLPL